MAHRSFNPSGKVLPVGVLLLASLVLAIGQGVATTREEGTHAPSAQSVHPWVRTIAQRQTADGSTVAEVLAYVESQRPEQFKVASMDVRFGGLDGPPEAVVIAYWIGANRKENDSYVDLSYALSPHGKVEPIARGALTLRALEAGKAPFLQQVDQIYAMACKPFPDAKARC